MHKSRLVPLMAVLLIILLCSWAWWERDRVAPVLINPLLEGSRIDDLHGLQFSFGRIDIERLRIALDTGAELQLEDMQLLRPFSMMFSAQNNRGRVTIAKLKFIPPDTTVTAARAQGRSDEQAERDLKLSDTIRLLQTYLPENLRIPELTWQGKSPQSAALEFRRDHDKKIISADLSSGEQQLSLEIRPRGNQLELVASLGTEGQDAALSLHGKLIPADADTWRASAQLEADLQRVTGLPLSGQLDKVAASASGQLSASIESVVPDALLHLQDYRETTAELQSKSLHLVLPETLLGVPLDFLLSTDDGSIAIALTSLRPVRGEEISGSATVSLTPAGQQQRLLDLKIGADTEKGVPVIGIQGTLNLEAANPILKARRWHEKLSTATIDSPSGSIFFTGGAKLKPLLGKKDSNHDWLRDINLTLSPDSRATIHFTAGKAKESLPTQLGWKQGKIEAQLTQALKLHMPHWPGSIQVAGEGAALQLTADGGKEMLDTKLREIHCTVSEGASCSLNFSATAENFTHKPNTLSMHKPTIDTQLKLTIQESGQRWQFRQTELSAQKITKGDIETENLLLASPLLDCTLTNGKQTCSSTELNTNFSIFKADELTVSGAVKFGDIQFQQHNDQLQLSSSYRSDGLKLNVQGRYQFDSTLSGKLDVKGQALSGETQIQSGSLQTRTTWHHNLDTAKGAAEFTLDATEFSQKEPLSESVSGLPMDIVAGTLSATGSFSWPQVQAQRDAVQVELNDVAVIYQDSFATGIQAKLTLNREGEHWLTTEPRPVKADTLDVGLPIADIHFTFSLDKDGDLKLGSLGAKLLSGTLQSETLTWNLNGKQRRSLILLSEISLRELARETETENFAATGIVDMRIPLITGADGVTVEKGTIEARPPGGRLRYYGAFSAEMLSSNPQLKLIAGALEDYSYRALSGTLEYPPSGDMQLQLKLVGRSKSVDADRDLIINLNLENNIPAMLRSLQASRDLTEALEKQIQ